MMILRESPPRIPNNREQGAREQSAVGVGSSAVGKGAPLRISVFPFYLLVLM